MEYGKQAGMAHVRMNVLIFSCSSIRLMSVLVGRCEYYSSPYCCCGGGATMYDTA
jgi:hypothetical protein